MISHSATLDAMGLLCPIPIIKTAARIKEMKVGAVLKILSDDPGILEDMPAWCRSTGHELLKMEELGNEFHVYVRKTK